MRVKSWFWGIIFLAAAVLVIGGQIGAFEKIGFWSVAAAVLLAGVAVESLIDLNFFGVLIPVALLYMIFQAPLHLIFIPFWQLILAAVLASIGLSMIIHRRHHWEKHNWEWHGHGKTKDSVSGSDIYLKSSFNDSCKYLHSDCLKKAHLVSSFGNLVVYMDKVVPDPDGTKVLVDVRFGNMTLYLSKNWQVVNSISENAASKVDDAGNCEPTENAPTITLLGDVSFGQLQIRYI